MAETKPSVCFFADCTAHSMIGYWHDSVVCLSVCDAAHCG